MSGLFFADCADEPRPRPRPRPLPRVEPGVSPGVPLPRLFDRIWPNADKKSLFEKACDHGHSLILRESLKSHYGNSLLFVVNA